MDSTVHMSGHTTNASVLTAFYANMMGLPCQHHQSQTFLVYACFMNHFVVTAKWMPVWERSAIVVHQVKKFVMVNPVPH